MYKQTLDKLKGEGLLRTLRPLGKDLLVFCSNDYLGLTKHPYVIKKTHDALKLYGTGSGASPLISGHSEEHERLRKKIARHKRLKSALLFSSGYAANVGAITALLNEKDTVIIDRLNHASIIDACRLSKAKLQVYGHKDMTALKKILERSKGFGKRLIVTDTVFSMDGDIAPIAEIVSLAKHYNAMSMVDDAHATGVLEENKAGVDIVMGTMSKALAAQGGFVAGPKLLIDYLANKARSFIYSTALPPHVCATAYAALEVVEENPGIREKLWANVNYLKEGLGLKSESQILPIMVGDSGKAVKIAKRLLKQGILLSAIRPPTVPANTARLRLTVTSAHTREQMDKLKQEIQKELYHRK
ncbi:MAG: 8-amino-7-oxononanoate synthase [Candidatus Margulisbacteria bacterium]|nr:8-amino-7-oxononanoate synthase [Candidatus Margulisiibacteriota bacterium]